MTSEFDLIQELIDSLGTSGERVLIANGDDAAVVAGEGVTVTSTDSYVEDVHFRLSQTSMYDLGHKCTAGALSDLAAMGAGGGEIYIAAGLPPTIGREQLLDLVRGAHAVAGETGSAICGGDIVRSEKLFLTVTVNGHARSQDELVRRDTAANGDLVGVTGTLGGSHAGLMLLNGTSSDLDATLTERLVDRYRRPMPQIAAGRALAATGVNAMLDVSDGIASDALRIAEASRVKLTIELGKLPAQNGVDRVASALDRDRAEFTAAGGEDYELLFSAPAELSDAIERAAQDAGTSVSWIGTVGAGEGVRLLDEGGAPRALLGWDHLDDSMAKPDRR